MNCPQCGAANLEAARFCLRCGHGLAGAAGRTCTVCGTVLPAEARFCIGCGSAVAEGPPEPGAPARVAALARLMPQQYVDQLLAARGRVSSERRVITILFFDVKGSTAMAENLDPEDVMEIMNEAFAALLEPVYRREGTLARLMGDGILCFFGAPIAHEDDAARACRCGLDILAAADAFAADLARRRGLSGFGVRVGINTGLVVVGEVGADLRVEYTAMGDAVNLAARMESAAEPGTVLITEHTHRMVRERFDCLPLGEMQVRGRREPVRVYRLLAPAASGREPGSSRPGAGRHAELVGRDREMAEIEGALAELAGGRGGLVAIPGEAGMGKSRLVHEARARVPTGVTWAEGRSLPDSASTSYWLLRDALRPLLGAGAEAVEPLEGLRLELERFLPGQSEELLPVLASVLSLPLDGPLAARLSRLEPSELQSEIERSLREFLRARARANPLAMVLEDLHWIDPSSLRLLEALLPLAGEAPLLFLLTYRADEGPAQELHRRLAGRRSPSCRCVPLAPLGPGDSGRLLLGLLGVREAPAEVLRLVQARAEGNALYLEEVLRSLLDEGALEIDADGARLVRPLGPLEVPTTLQGVLMARIDRLAPADKRVLQTASALGRSFLTELLAEVMGQPLGGRDLAESLEELRRRDLLLLREEAEERLPGGPGGDAGPSGEAARRPQYVFKHALTMAVAYESLLRAERRELHRRAGEALEARARGALEETSPVLADHFEKAGVPGKAFEYLLRAAEAAARVSANPEAKGYYRRALALTETARAEASEIAVLTYPDVARAYEGLADVCYRMGEYDDALAACGFALPFLEDPVRRAALQRKRGQICEKSGRHAEARTWFEAGLEEMSGTGAEAEAARIYAGLSLVHYHEGRLENAVMVGAMALATMRKLGDSGGVAHACNTLGVSHAKLGDWESAVEHHLESLRIWESLGDAYGLAAAHNNLGLARRGQGRLREAVEHFERSAELFGKLGNPHGLARAFDNLSEAHLALGHEDESRRYLEKAVTLLAEISMDGSEMRPEMWRSGVW